MKGHKMDHDFFCRGSDNVLHLVSGNKQKPFVLFCFLIKTVHALSPYSTTTLERVWDQCTCILLCGQLPGYVSFCLGGMIFDHFHLGQLILIQFKPQVNRACPLSHCYRNASYDAGCPSHDAWHASCHAWNATRVSALSLTVE